MDGKELVIVVVGLLFVIQIAVPMLGLTSSAADQALNGQSQTDGSAFVDVTGTGYTSFASISGWDASSISSVVVNSSTGHAVRLTGADGSYINATGISLPDDESWSACSWVELNDGASENGTFLVLSVEENLHVTYNNSSYDALVYDSDDLNSDTVSVPANDPFNITLVCVSRSGDTVEITRNGNVSSSVTLTETSAAGNWEEGDNCPCRLEEIRVTDAKLNDSQVDTLRTDPVAPMPAADPVARVMFDAGSGGTAAVFWGGSATLHSASWTTGLTGETLTEGTHYEVDYENAEIKELNDAPALFVEYSRDGDSVLGNTDETSQSTISFAVVIAVILIGLWAIAQF